MELLEAEHRLRRAVLALILAEEDEPHANFDAALEYAEDRLADAAAAYLKARRNDGI
jgi:hypothetical protein